VPEVKEIAENSIIKYNEVLEDTWQRKREKITKR
jgi:hypothetical protein